MSAGTMPVSGIAGQTRTSMGDPLLGTAPLLPGYTQPPQSGAYFGHPVNQITPSQPAQGHDMQQYFQKMHENMNNMNQSISDMERSQGIQPQGGGKSAGAKSGQFNPSMITMDIKPEQIAGMGGPGRISSGPAPISAQSGALGATSGY